MYVPTFINAQNPQLRLLAEFLAVMAETNEEATCRVFGRLCIECTPGSLRVYGPTNQLDVYVKTVDEAAGERFVAPHDVERQEMILAIFDKIRRI